jgi:fatty acid desaturase
MYLLCRHKDSPTHRTTSTHYPATYHNERLLALQLEHLYAASFDRRTTFMLWTIIVILFILWLLGFTLHVGGGLIHILLVLAVIVLIYNLITGRRGL